MKKKELNTLRVFAIFCFYCHEFQRPSNCRREIFSEMQRRALNALNFNIECVNAFAVSLAHLQRELKISLPTWLSRRAQWRKKTLQNFPAHHISGIC